WRVCSVRRGCAPWSSLPAALPIGRPFLDHPSGQRCHAEPLFGSLDSELPVDVRGQLQPDELETGFFRDRRHFLALRLDPFLSHVVVPRLNWSHRDTSLSNDVPAVYIIDGGSRTSTM